jgi:ribosomal protein S18 acetylase RimI-like enzyme
MSTAHCLLRIARRGHRPVNLHTRASLGHGVFVECVIPAKLAVQPELFIVALDGVEVVGSIIAGYDGHRGWLYMLAVSNSHRRRHIGSALVQEAEARLAAMGCQKINLQVRTSNAAVAEFYKKLGYVIEERISSGRVFPLDHDPRLRT